MRARAGFAAALAVVVALGLGSRRVPLGVALWDKSLGDALYAVAVLCLAGVVRPGSSATRLGVVAFLASFTVELFQLTGLPARAPRPLRLVLGTTFAWHDVACYAIGALLAAGVVAGLRIRGPGRPRG